MRRPRATSPSRRTRGWVLLAGRLLGGTLAALLALLPAVLLCLWTHMIAPPEEHWPALLADLHRHRVLCRRPGRDPRRGIRGATDCGAGLPPSIATYLFFLGGGFTTIAFLPPWLRAVSAWVPMRYAIDGMRQALFYPDLDGVKHDLLMLCGAALAAMVIGSFFVRRAWAQAAR